MRLFKRKVKEIPKIEPIEVDPRPAILKEVNKVMGMFDIEMESVEIKETPDGYSVDIDFPI